MNYYYSIEIIAYIIVLQKKDKKEQKFESYYKDSQV